MRLEIGDGTQAGAGRRAPRPLHLRSYCHDGRKVLSSAAGSTARACLETPVNRPYGQAMNEAPVASARNYLAACKTNASDKLRDNFDRRGIQVKKLKPLLVAHKDRDEKAVCSVTGRCQKEGIAAAAGGLWGRAADALGPGL